MRSWILLALVAAVFARTYTEVDQIWTNCGKDSDHFHMSSITLSPDPPRIGQNVTIDVKGSLDEAVTGGDAELLVKFFGVKLLDLKKPVCEMDPQTYPCPIAAGPWGVHQDVEIPSATPKGHYQGLVTLKDQAGQEVLCYNFDFQMSK
ncbi:putative phospholipid transfer protein [Paratrimastix pyriformis]|uniref:Phospholipid transfer protein n=1 Tax=Paratrimastix pyriformis TaxID=342808 RepID=A0ABQ8U8S9_9EUKA|nr:putative phospholipid transfer protein [Paratrimastix pyriformis]|eukprot:GAFH01006005.1.p2 GENE.GAFH01006005.1~~GAFH01006005.1.p2  ORF type:complete len:148 (-),score=33.66 GAFH01006005.1:94-537(-)